MKYGEAGGRTQKNVASRQGGGRKNAGKSRVPGSPASRTEIPGFVRERSPHREQLRREQLIHQSVKKSRKRHRKSYILYYLLLGILLVVTLAVLSFTVFFKIETITVEGNGKLSVEDVIAASGVKIGDNLLRTNLERAENSVLAAFINLDRAEVKRHFPATLSIKAELSTAAAVVRYQNQYYALSQGGRVIGVEKRNSWMGVPEVAGCDFSEVQAGSYLTADLQSQWRGAIPADSDNRYDTLVAVLKAIKENDMQGIGYIDLKDITTIKLYFQDRVELRFGGIANLSYELSCVKKIVETELTADGCYIVDDTLANGSYYIRQPARLELPLTDPPAGGDSPGTDPPAGGDSPGTDGSPESSVSGAGETASGAVSSGEASSESAASTPESGGEDSPSE